MRAQRERLEEINRKLLEDVGHLVTEIDARNESTEEEPLLQSDSNIRVDGEDVTYESVKGRHREFLSADTTYASFDSLKKQVAVLHSIKLALETAMGPSILKETENKTAPLVKDIQTRAGTIGALLSTIKAYVPSQNTNNIRPALKMFVQSQDYKQLQKRSLVTADYSQSTKIKLKDTVPDDKARVDVDKRLLAKVDRLNSLFDRLEKATSRQDNATGPLDKVTSKVAVKYLSRQLEQSIQAFQKDTVALDRLSSTKPSTGPEIVTAPQKPK